MGFKSTPEKSQELHCFSATFSAVYRFIVGELWLNARLCECMKLCKICHPKNRKIAVLGTHVVFSKMSKYRKLLNNHKIDSIRFLCMFDCIYSYHHKSLEISAELLWNHCKWWNRFIMEITPNPFPQRIQLWLRRHLELWIELCNIFYAKSIWSVYLVL